MDWQAVREKLLRYRLIDTIRPPTNGKRCWLFNGCRNSDGYGSIRLTDRDTKLDGPNGPATRSKTWIEYAHRASAAAFKGFDLNSDEVVAHDCNNPGCFNPFHLTPKSHVENVLDTADRIGAGRGKLDVETVDALRRYVKRHNGRSNLVKFAASRGVSYASILRAAKGITYATCNPMLFSTREIARPVPEIRKSKPFRGRRKDIPF